MKTFRYGLFALVIIVGASCSNPFTTPADLIDGDGVRLETELVMPVGGRDLKPAVVFVGGSGAAHFREYVPGFTEILIEEIFLPRDIAVFYYNKRGVGESSGSWKWGSIERRAEDTLTAVDHLRNEPGIDPNRIGLIGHSQGGWVVQLAGSLDEDIEFVISFSGPTVSVREQDTHRVENSLRCEGVSGEELEAKLAKLDRQHERKISVGAWFPFFEMRFAANIFQYDPWEALRGLTQPTLLAFGGLDNMVPPEPNRDRMNEIFAATGVPSNFTWYTAANTDHMFRMADTICFDYEASIGNPYSDEFVAYLEEWVNQLGLSN